MVVIKITNSSLPDFCKKCKQIGIDGVILPDMPVQEFVDEYKQVFDYYSIYNIFLITPLTSINRIKKIDSISKGFVYTLGSFSDKALAFQVRDRTTR